MSKILMLVRSRIESAIAQEIAKGHEARQDAEMLGYEAQETRKRIMSTPDYQPYDERNEKTHEAHLIDAAYAKRDKAFAEACEHEKEAAAYKRLLAKLFGDSEIMGLEQEGKP